MLGCCSLQAVCSSWVTGVVHTIMPSQPSPQPWTIWELSWRWKYSEGIRLLVETTFLANMLTHWLQWSRLSLWTVSCFVCPQISVSTAVCTKQTCVCPIRLIICHYRHHLQSSASAHWCRHRSEQIANLFVCTWPTVAWLAIRLFDQTAFGWLRLERPSVSRRFKSNQIYIDIQHR